MFLVAAEVVKTYKAQGTETICVKLDAVHIKQVRNTAMTNSTPPHSGRHFGTSAVSPLPWEVGTADDMVYCADMCQCVVLMAYTTNWVCCSIQMDTVMCTSVQGRQFMQSVQTKSWLTAPLCSFTASIYHATCVTHAESNDLTCPLLRCPHLTLQQYSQY